MCACCVVCLLRVCLVCVFCVRMLPKPALLSSIEVPEPALSLSSAGLALLRVLAVSMYFIGTIPDNGTTQPALYRPPHCTLPPLLSQDRCKFSALVPRQQLLELAYSGLGLLRFPLQKPESTKQTVLTRLQTHNFRPRHQLSYR